MEGPGSLEAVASLHLAGAHLSCLSNQEWFEARVVRQTRLAVVRRGRGPVDSHPGGPMVSFKPGIHLLIKKTQATIVPVGIAGAYEAWPRWRAYPIPAPLFLPARPGTIGVVIGEPVSASHFAELPRDKALADLFDRIAALRDQAEHLRRK